MFLACQSTRMAGLEALLLRSSNSSPPSPRPLFEPTSRQAPQHQHHWYITYTRPRQAPGDKLHATYVSHYVSSLGNDAVNSGTSLVLERPHLQSSALRSSTLHSSIFDSSLFDLRLLTLRSSTPHSSITNTLYTITKHYTS
jgi:hypothetical protein